MMQIIYKILDLWAYSKDALRRMLSPRPQSPRPQLSAEQRRERNETIAAFSADAAKNGRFTPEEFRAEFLRPLVETHGEAAVAKALANARMRRRKNRYHVPTR